MAGTFAGDFADARPVAQHCAELIRRGPRPEERSEHLAAWCRDMGQEFAAELGQLLSGGKLRVTVSAPDITKGSEVFERIGPVAANSLLRCGPGDTTLLLSFDFATAIAMTDCSFGGEGETPDSVPSQLPRSAALMVEQVAGTIARVIASASDPSDAPRGDVLVRSDSVTRLKPFAADAEVACFPVLIAMGGIIEWNLLIVIESEQLDALLPGLDAPSPKRTRATRPGEAATNGAFAAMPLPLEAVLGEFELSLERLERLSPGDEIPLAIPRELPLKVGEDVLGHGKLGTLENRMALRLTRLVGKDRPAPQELAA